ncbi:hypothetical protein BJP25_00880 [Actinokineospora bangkokensis]|uniref:Uncharacterized protein n=2 Tax=Actinokineospora bangkokensis TaxID=1193682 RepID=A0A1Q9LHI6_9PSEU|nr:hypothetical protein BJP25_00880 [Actinokineospora bangkokensis]
MPTKSGTGELRTDLAPLTKRFPGLADARSAQWMSGTLGDDRVPGPSTYWIDAVVTLPPAKVSEVTPGTRETTDQPPVVDGLRDDVPEGPYLTSDALNSTFTGQGWFVHAYLAKGTDKLVLVATGQ